MAGIDVPSGCGDGVGVAEVWVGVGAVTVCLGPTVANTRGASLPLSGDDPSPHAMNVLTSPASERSASVLATDTANLGTAVP